MTSWIVNFNHLLQNLSWSIQIRKLNICVESMQYLTLLRMHCTWWGSTGDSIQASIIWVQTWSKNVTLCILGIINTNSQKQPGQWSHGQGLIKDYEILRNKLKYRGQANLSPFDPNNLFKTKADLSHLRYKKAEILQSYIIGVWRFLFLFFQIRFRVG